MERVVAMVSWQRVEQLLRDDARITDDPDIRRHVRADCAWVDVDVHDRGVTEDSSVRHGPLVQTHAERKNAVNLSKDLGTGIGCESADDAEIEPMPTEEPVGEDRGSKQGADTLHECP